MLEQADKWLTNNTKTKYIQKQSTFFHIVIKNGSNE